jgi:hypothetical protein
MRTVLALAALTLMGGCYAETYPYGYGYRGYNRSAYYRPYYAPPRVYVPPPRVYVPPPRSYVVPPPPPHRHWR